MARTARKSIPDRDAVAGRRGSKAKAARFGAILVGAIAVGWLTVAVSIAGITRYDQPERALAVLPFDAVANATLADRLLQTTPGSTMEAEVLARRAIARTPLSPVAMRVLAFAADERGDRQLASRRIAYAAVMSRRDLPTHLWLIEDAVRHNDVSTALDHYDMALRTSRFAAPVLYPVLAGALADREFGPPMTTVLRRNPAWLIDFVPYALHQGGATENIARVLEGLPAAGKDRDRQLAVTVIGQLVAEQRYDAAAHFLGSAIGRNAGTSASDARQVALLDSDDGALPFAWSIVQTPELGAEKIEGGLSVYAGGGASGIVASRLLVLAPGRYRLTGRGTFEEQAAQSTVAWTISCGVPAERVIAELPLVAATSGGVDFDVDRACRGQWLRLSVHNATASDEFKAQVAQIGLIRVAAR